MLAGYTRVFNRPGVGKSWRLGERVAKKTLIILLGVCDGSEHFEKLKLKNYYTLYNIKKSFKCSFFKKKLWKFNEREKGKGEGIRLG